jgi:hypothetical protein
VSYTVVVSLDFDNDGYGAGDVITPYVIDASLSAGFSGEMRHTADIGQAFITLDNSDRRFSPSYAAGPYYGKLLPNRPIKVTVSDGVTTWTCWSGVLKELTPVAGIGRGAKALLVAEDSLTLYQRETIDLPVQERITAGRL